MSLETAQKILRDHLKKECQEIIPIEKGYNNRTYICKCKGENDVVIRLGGRFWKFYKTVGLRYFYLPFQEAEVGCIHFLRQKTKIPVPQVLYYDSVGEEIGHEYIVMTKIPGTCLEDEWKSFHWKQKMEVLDQLADYVIQMKQQRSKHIGSLYFKKKVTNHLFDEWVESEEFGDLVVSDTTDCGLFPDFTSYMKQMLQNYINRVVNKPERHGSLKDFLPQAKHLLDHMEQILKEANDTTVISLSHKDLTFRNIIVDGTKITGIIDWEWGGFFPEDEELVGSYEFVNDEKDPDVNLVREYFFEALKSRGGYTPETLPHFSKRRLCYEIGDNLSPWVLDQQDDVEKHVIPEAKKKLEKLFVEIYQ